MELTSHQSSVYMESLLMLRQNQPARADDCGNTRTSDVTGLAYESNMDTRVGRSVRQQILRNVWRRGG
jgi:hypothetical protein